MFNKKGEALTVTIVLILLLVFIGWLVNMGGRECSRDGDCRSGYYCGVDHGCHKIPVIEKSPVVVHRDYTKPSLIIGGAIVIAAAFFNWDKIKPRPRKQEGPEIYY